jgi:hypothetical protein
MQSSAMTPPRKHIDDNARKRAYKNKHREEINGKQRTAYAELTEEIKAHRRENNKDAVKKFRIRKQQKRLEASSSTNGSAYKTPQAFGRAAKKVKSALPKSPSKATYVMQYLLKKSHQPQSLPLPERISITPWNAISSDAHGKIIKFYTESDVVWISPNARDYVRIPGCKERMTRCYLMCALKEAHGIFLEKHPEMAVSYSQFCKLRPLHVKLNLDIPHIVCLCKQHENFR